MIELDKKSKAVVTYKGKVTTRIQKGCDTVITKQYHNQGLPKLFLELGNLFTTRDKQELDKIFDNLVPYSIALYTFRADSFADNFNHTHSWEALTDKTVSLAGDMTSALVRVTPFLNISKSFVQTKDNSIVLQFSIPGNMLTTKKIYVLALFPRDLNSVFPEKSALAFYRLASEDGKWDPMTVLPTNNVFIEWQMIFDNA